MVYGNNSVLLRFMEIAWQPYQAFTSRHSTCNLTLILPHYIAKSLAIKAFHYPFRQRFLGFHDQRHILGFAVTVSFRRSLLTLRQIYHERNICFYFVSRTSSDSASTFSDIFLYTNRRKSMTMILKWYYETERLSPLPKETTSIIPLEITIEDSLTIII